MAHTTKYGNTYTDEEWTELQDHYKEEEKKDNDISEKINGMTIYLKKQLKKEKLNEKQIDQVVNLFKTGYYETKKIQWTSNKRKNTIDNLWQRWNVAMENLGKEYL